MCFCCLGSGFKHEVGMLILLMTFLTAVAFLAKKVIFRNSKFTEENV